MSLLLTTLPEDFPEEIITEPFFLEGLCGPVAIWLVRIAAVLIFAGIIGWWIYLEYKNRPEE